MTTLTETLLEKIENDYRNGGVTSTYGLSVADRKRVLRYLISLPTVTKVTE
jgi:hypothetical protein